MTAFFIGVYFLLQGAATSLILVLVLDENL